jgi:alpha-L-fucosidase
VKNRERLTDDAYQVYFDHFDPDLYDPRGWVDLAAEAGMRYAVITTKHHDGFCLWETATTDYSAPNTPAGRDLIAPFVAALRERGFGVGLYHSLIDWHHPHFPVDGLHPRRDDAEAVASNSARDIGLYRSYLHRQVEELLTRFAPVDQVWFDFSYEDHVHDGLAVTGGKGPEAWGSEDLLALVRRVQPRALVNDRLGIPGDFTTPEQYQPATAPTRDGRPVLWEACQTINGSWGYDRDNTDDKSPDLLIRMLIDTVSKNGNFLLNVGPNARGEIDPRQAETLRAIGRWMRLHSRAIYGAGPSTFTPPADCRYTQRGDRLFVHLFAWPFEALHLTGLAGRVRLARFLHDGSQVRTTIAGTSEEAYVTASGPQPPGTLTLELPIRRPDVAIPVVELILG